MVLNLLDKHVSFPQ